MNYYQKLENYETFSSIHKSTHRIVLLMYIDNSELSLSWLQNSYAFVDQVLCKLQQLIFAEREVAEKGKYLLENICSRENSSI